MFCYKCGKQIPDDAVFCYSCGSKVNNIANEEKSAPETAPNAELPEIKESVTDNIAPVKKEISTAESPNSIIENGKTAEDTPIKEAIPTSGKEAFEYFNSKKSECAAIKNVEYKEKFDSCILSGSVHNYGVKVLNKVPKVTVGLTMMYSILFGIAVGGFAMIAATAGWDLIDGYGIEFEPMVIIGLLMMFTGGFAGILTVFQGKKERSDIVNYIYEAFGQTPPPKADSVNSILGVSIAIIVIAIIITIAGAVSSGIFDSKGSSENTDKIEEVSDSDQEDTDNSIAENTVEDDIASEVQANEPETNDTIELTKSYDSETFSFDYPSTWETQDISGYKDEGIVALISAPANDIGYSANMAIACYDKSFDDFDYMNASLSECEEAYGAVSGRTNTRIEALDRLDLDGCDSRRIMISYDDQRGSYIQTQYVYYNGSDMYFVNFTSLKDEYDMYGDVLDAIMDTYSISSSNDDNSMSSEFTPRSGIFANGSNGNEMELAFYSDSTTTNDIVGTFSYYVEWLDEYFDGTIYATGKDNEYYLENDVGSADDNMYVRMDGDSFELFYNDENRTYDGTYQKISALGE